MEFVNLFLPLVENEEITGGMRTDGENDAVNEFIGKLSILPVHAPSIRSPHNISNFSFPPPSPHSALQIQLHQQYELKLRLFLIFHVSFIVDHHHNCYIFIMCTYESCLIKYFIPFMYKQSARICSGDLSAAEVSWLPDSIMDVRSSGFLRPRIGGLSISNRSTGERWNKQLRGRCRRC